MKDLNYHFRKFRFILRAVGDIIDFEAENALWIRPIWYADELPVVEARSRETLKGQMFKMM